MKRTLSLLGTLALLITPLASRADDKAMPHYAPTETTVDRRQVGHA